MDETQVLEGLKEVRSLIKVAQTAEIAQDTVIAQNNYSSAVNVVLQLIQKLKEPPFSAPDSIDSLSNIALYLSSRIRVLGFLAQQGDMGIAKLVKQDAQTVLKDIRSAFDKIREKMESEDITAGGFGEYTALDDLTGFDQLFGNEEIVKKLKSFKRAPVKKATLLFGPPGSGKTSFAKAFAKFLGLNFRLVDVSQLISSYQGQTEKNVKSLFDQINENENELVLLDEAETLIQDRSTASSLASAATTVATFLVHFESMKHPSHMVLTTNYASRVDPAIMRRLNAIFIPYPAPGQDALDVFMRILRLYNISDISPEDWDVLRNGFLQKTENQVYSPADFAVAIDNQVIRQYEEDPLLVTCGITRGASSNKISQAREGSFCMIDPNGKPANDEDNVIPHPFNTTDIMRIIENLQPTVTNEQYLGYQR